MYSFDARLEHSPTENASLEMLLGFCRHQKIFFSYSIVPQDTKRSLVSSTYIKLTCFIYLYIPYPLQNLFSLPLCPFPPLPALQVNLTLFSPKPKGPTRTRNTTLITKSKWSFIPFFPTGPRCKPLDVRPCTTGVCFPTSSVTKCFFRLSPNLRPLQYFLLPYPNPVTSRSFVASAVPSLDTSHTSGILLHMCRN